MIFNIFVWKFFLFRFLHQIKHWAKPITLSLISDVLSDLTRTRSDLIVENALLRQQLIVLNRQVKRPQLTRTDRFRLVLLRGLPNFGNKLFILFSLIPCSAGIGICFASIGD